MIDNMGKRDRDRMRKIGATGFGRRRAAAFRDYLAAIERDYDADRRLAELKRREAVRSEEAREYRAALAQGFLWRRDFIDVMREERDQC